MLHKELSKYLSNEDLGNILDDCLKILNNLEIKLNLYKKPNLDKNIQQNLNDIKEIVTKCQKISSIEYEKQLFLN